MLNSIFPDFLPYWRNESSGKLAEAVERYFAFAVGDDLTPLTDSELVLLKGYLKFWVEYPWQVSALNLNALRAKFDEVESYEQLRDCIELALDLGIDPF